ncbi:RasGEF [Balamuthia mandrillaris]
MTNNNNSAMEDPTNLDTAESIKQRVQERKEREVDRRQRIALKHWDEISSSSCTALARELTAYDYDLFMKIPDSEFFEWQRSGSNDKAYHCPNIVAFIRRFDEVSFWVSTAILIQLTHKDRRKVVKSMIKLAKELHGIGNYNGLIQIISGLNNSYVQRLKSLWQDGALPDKYISTFQDLEAVCSPLHNFTHYRKEFKERQAPKLPYFALFLRDLTIIKEANSLYTEEGLINSGLVQLTADFIRHFRSCHKTASPYHRLRRMTRDPALTSKLSYLYHVDEETLSALSSKIQPTKINTFAIEEVYSDEGAVINTPHPSGAVSDTAAESMASPADVEDIEHRDRALSQESYERYVRSGTLKFENERCLLLRADSLCGCLLRENQDGRWGSMQPDHLITFLYDHSYSMGKNDAVGVLTAFPNLHQQLSYLPLHWNVNKTLANIPKETQETLRFLDAAIFHCAHTGWGLAIVIDRPRDESATTQTPRPDLASSFPSSCSFECFQLTNNEATTYFPMRTEADLNAFCVLIDLEHSFEAESFLKRSPQLSGCYRRPRTPILQRRSRSPSPRRSSSSPSTQCKPSAVSNKRSSSPTKQFSSSSTSSSPSLSSSAPSTTPMPKLYTPLSSSPSPSSSTSPSVTFKSLALEMSQVATTIQNKTAAIKKKKRKEKKPTQEWRRSHRTRRKNEEDDERSAASCRCAMFAGYIGGWMEGCRRHFMENDEQPNERRKEGTNGPSADNPRLVAAEVLCRAKGDETCRFLLAYSPFIHQKVQQYFENQEEQQTKEEEEEDAEAEVRALTFDLPAGFLELDDRKEDGTEETKKTETKKLNNKENAGSNKRLPPYLVPHVREEILSSIATRTEPILKAANPTKAEEEVHNKQHSLIRNSTNSERKDTLKNMETESQIHLQVQTFKTWKQRQKKVTPAFTALLQDMRLEPSNGVIIMKQKRVLSPRSSAEQTQQPSGEEVGSPRMGRILTSPRSSITANNKERFVLLRNSFLWQPEEGEQDHWKELKYTLGHTLGKSDQRYFSSKLNTVFRLAIPSSTSMEGDAEGRAAFEEVVAKRVLGLTTVMARTGWGVPSFDFYDCNLGDIPSPRRTAHEDETKEENEINETVNEFCVKLFVTSSLEAEVFLRQHRKASDKEEQDRRKEGEGNNEQTNNTQMRNSRSASTSARVDHLRLDSPVTNLSRDSFSVPPDNKTQLYSSSPVCLTCAGYCGGFVEEAFAANAHPHHQRAPSSPSPSPPAGMEGEQPSPPPSPSSRQPHHQPCKVAAVEVACEGMGHSCCELILGSSGSIFRHIWKHLQETGTVNMWPRLNLIPLIDESNVKDYVLYDRLYRSLSLERQSSVDVADTEGDVEAEQKKQGTESKEDALAQLKGEQENNNKAKDKDLQEKLQIVMERVKELKEGANKVNIAEETEKENSLATLAEGMSASRLLLLERLRAATVECGISSEEEEKKKQAGEAETEAAVAEQEEAEEEEEEDDESVDFYAWVAELRRRGGRGSEDEKRKKERIFREKMKRLSLMDHASSQPTINVIPRTGSSNAAGGGLRGSKRRSLVSKKEKKEVHSPQLQRKEEKQKSHGSKRKSFGGLLVGALGTSSSPASSAEHSATANEENDDGKLKQAERTVPTNSPAKSKKSKKEQKLVWLKRDIMFGKVKDENHKVMTKEKKQSENERKRQKRMRRKSSHLPSTIVKTLKKQEEEPLEENDKQGGETKQRKGTMLRQQELNALKMMGQISLVDQLSDTNAVLSVDGTLATTASLKTGGGERRNNLTI